MQTGAPVDPAGLVGFLQASIGETHLRFVTESIRGRDMGQGYRYGDLVELVTHLLSPTDENGRAKLGHTDPRNDPAVKGISYIFANLADDVRRLHNVSGPEAAQRLVHDRFSQLIEGFQNGTIVNALNSLPPARKSLFDLNSIMIHQILDIAGCPRELLAAGAKSFQAGQGFFTAHIPPAKPASPGRRGVLGLTRNS